MTRYSELEGLVAEAALIVALVEWEGINCRIDGDFVSKRCPLCFNPHHMGHTSDCRLAAFLAKTLPKVSSVTCAMPRSPISCMSEWKTSCGGNDVYLCHSKDWTACVHARPVAKTRGGSR